MKKFILFLTVLLIALGCEKDKIEIDKGKLDPNATITIRPAEGVKTRATISGD